MDNYHQSRMKIMIVAGTRPDFIKAAPLIKRMGRYNDFLEPILVHAGQHYDDNLSHNLIDELGLLGPEIHLETGSGSPALQIGKLMNEFERALLELQPHIIVTIGGANTAMASAIIAAKHKIPVAHLEAGLRSGDMSSTEEINRLLVDSISQYLFASERAAYQNLLNSGTPEEKIFFVGSTAIDSLNSLLVTAQTRTIKNDLKLGSKKYALLTLHHPPNIENRKTLEMIIQAVATLSSKIPVVFPCHPRTRLVLEKYGLTPYFANPMIRLIEPLGYLDFIKLESEATMAITDSSGVQEETTMLNVPCLTLLKCTERNSTINEGTNILVGPYPEKLIAEAENIIGGNIKKGNAPKYWDGRAAERTVDEFMKIRDKMLAPGPVRGGTTKIKITEVGISKG